MSNKPCEGCLYDSGTYGVCAENNKLLPTARVKKCKRRVPVRDGCDKGQTTDKDKALIDSDGVKVSYVYESEEGFWVRLESMGGSTEVRQEVFLRSHTRGSAEDLRIAIIRLAANAITGK
jgi:hypothetical protein